MKPVYELKMLKDYKALSLKSSLVFGIERSEFKPNFCKIPVLAVIRIQRPTLTFRTVKEIGNALRLVDTDSHLEQ